MEFDLRHRFAAPTTVVADAILDRSYQESLDGIGPLRSRTLLAQDEVDGVVVRKVRCVLDADFAGPAKAILGNSDPAWVEESTWSPEAMEWKWTIHPEVAASILSAHGVMALYPDGEGTSRKVAGEIDVNFPFIGGNIANAIVTGVTQVYDEEAERLARWLNEHRS